MWDGCLARPVLSDSSQDFLILIVITFESQMRLCYLGSGIVGVNPTPGPTRVGVNPTPGPTRVGVNPTPTIPEPSFTAHSAINGVVPSIPLSLITGTMNTALATFSATPARPHPNHRGQWEHQVLSVVSDWQLVDAKQ